MSFDDNNQRSFPISINADYFLQYYFHSEELFGLTPSSLNHPAVDLPRVHIKWVGKQWNPAYVAWWGLINLNKNKIKPFEASVRWLRDNSVDCGNTLVWTYSFDWVEGKAILKTPWISAIAQGLAVSALVRAWRLHGDRNDLIFAQKAAEVFWVPISDGGVMDISEGMHFLEEYPSKPFPHVFDGFCFALLALYDLDLESGTRRPYRELLNQCLDTLEAYLPKWDFLNMWSWYGNEGFLCNRQYHSLNHIMLLVLYKLTGRELLNRYAEMWNPMRLNQAQKIVIFTVSQATLLLRRTQYNRIRRDHYRIHP